MSVKCNGPNVQKFNSPILTVVAVIYTGYKDITVRGHGSTLEVMEWTIIEKLLKALTPSGCPTLTEAFVLYPGNRQIGGSV